MSNLKNILLKKKICKSVWFMRQAGRYLPEFRELRLKNPNFIELCLNSDLASEITLQPIKRFNLDSAIIFSDILMVPYALGQEVTFIKDEGPKLSEFRMDNFSRNNKLEFSKKLAPIYKAIEITRSKLDKTKSLVCFIGAPWTLLVYMLNLKKNKNEINLEKLENKDLKFNLIINKLIEYLCIHIQGQINAGADVVQIFDSWAGLIPDKSIQDFCYKPNAKIVEFCKKKQIANICFPKGINKKFENFHQMVKPDGLNLDPEIDPLWARDKLINVVLQGGLNPKFLLKSEESLFNEATKYLNAFKEIPYVFNLGHGLLPETDPDKVNNLVKFYRNFK